MVMTWWVNQGQSFARGADALKDVWAPLANTKGGEVASWRQLTEVREGDILIHYARSAIRGFSIAQSEAFSCLRPWPDPDDQNRAGRRIYVEFVELAIPVPLSDIPFSVRLSQDPGPFDKKGDVKQGYLFPVGKEAEQSLLDLLEVTIDIRESKTGREDTLVNGETDRLGVANYRVEQPMLRRRVLRGRTTAECDLCGDEFPEAFLVAAHIKQRASATDRERRDVGNVMLACTFGCDAAFEHGALRVGRTGEIYINGNVSGAPLARLESLRGRRVTKHDQSTRRYFAARERSFG